MEGVVLFQPPSRDLNGTTNTLFSKTQRDVLVSERRLALAFHRTRHAGSVWAFFLGGFPRFSSTKKKIKSWKSWARFYGARAKEPEPEVQSQEPVCLKRWECWPELQARVTSIPFCWDDNWHSANELVVKTEPTKAWRRCKKTFIALCLDGQRNDMNLWEPGWSLADSDHIMIIGGQWPHHEPEVLQTKQKQWFLFDSMVQGYKISASKSRDQPTDQTWSTNRSRDFWEPAEHLSGLWRVYLDWSKPPVGIRFLQWDVRITRGHMSQAGTWPRDSRDTAAYVRGMLREARPTCAKAEEQILASFLVPKWYYWAVVSTNRACTSTGLDS